MPILNVKISAKRSPEMTRSIANILLDLTSRILHKDPQVTSIAIEYVEPENWIVAGKSLADHGKSSIYFDVKITDETNTKLEKAEYIRQAFKAFAELLGDLHEESYIYVQDVRATSYGYGGKTQEYRFHQV
jgi:4-oxalocrotonate tautomerase